MLRKSAFFPTSLYADSDDLRLFSGVHTNRSPAVYMNCFQALKYVYIAIYFKNDYTTHALAFQIKLHSCTNNGSLYVHNAYILYVFS